MATLHAYTGYLVVAANLAAGVWGLALWKRRSEPDRAFWIALGTAWALIAVQGFFGLAMYQERQPAFRHHFYGFLFAVILIAVLPLRSEQPRTRLVVFSSATLFVGIVAIRAVASG